MCAMGPPNDVGPSARNAAKTSAGVPLSGDERNAFAAQCEPPPLGSHRHDAYRLLNRIVAAALRAQLDRARRTAELEANFREFAVLVTTAHAVVLVQHERRLRVAARGVDAKLARALVVQRIEGVRIGQRDHAARG